MLFLVSIALHAIKGKGLRCPTRTHLILVGPAQNQSSESGDDIVLSDDLYWLVVIIFSPNGW